MQRIIGAALACQMITGASAVWNWQAHFDYADRITERPFHYNTNAPYADFYKGPRPIKNSHRNMWDAYRSSCGTAIWNR